MPGAFPVVFPDKPADHRAYAHIHAHAYSHEKEKQREHQTGARKDRRGFEIYSRNKNGIDKSIAKLKHKPNKHGQADFYGNGNDRTVEHARNFLKFIIDGIFLDKNNQPATGQVGYYSPPLPYSKGDTVTKVPR